MFRFSGLCQFGVQEHSFSPCIGVIDTYDMREVKKLVKRWRLLLDTVCCDNIGRVERGLDSGAEKAGIYVRYSCYDDFCRKNPDVKGCIDMFYWYNGLYAFYRTLEVREYLSGIAPAQIRPYGLSDQDCERILKESHDPLARRVYFNNESIDGMQGRLAMNTAFNMGVLLQELLMFEDGDARIDDGAVLYREKNMHTGEFVYVTFGDLKQGIIDMKRKLGLDGLVKKE